MNSKVKSPLWPKVNELMRKCHLQSIMPDTATEEDWYLAFNTLMEAVKEERKENPDFSPELCDLTNATGNTYGFSEILEEYFDHLEDKEEWDEVILSCDRLLTSFTWKKQLPSEYMYRKGTALEKLKKFDEAEAFGKKWLSDYPNDNYAAASNVFLLVEMGKLDEAKELCEKYMHDELVCDNDTDTLFMAAYRLYELTDDVNAKQRVAARIAQYNLMNR